MNYLWSPWRMKYILSNKKEDGCVFCNVQKMPDNEENLIVYRGKNAYVIMNRFPYTSGHVLVLPYVHENNLEVLPDATSTEMMALATKTMSVLRSVYQPQGFNFGANIGAAAGAGIAPHVHLHILPRWNGDTNFMTALGETRVVPEALDDSYWRVRKGWENP
jgi:ATP adenylyltransferase